MNFIITWIVQNKFLFWDLLIYYLKQWIKWEGRRKNIKIERYWIGHVYLQFWETLYVFQVSFPRIVTHICSFSSILSQNLLSNMFSYFSPGFNSFTWDQLNTMFLFAYGLVYFWMNNLMHFRFSSEKSNWDNRLDQLILAG